jgi:secreted trypsin-like serine protease
MRLRYAVAALATAVLGSIAAVAVMPQANAIVGGDEVGDAPWAAVFWSDNNQCSATIIARDWVLTAEHCVGLQRNMRVRVGSVFASSGGQTRAISDFRLQADLALLRLGSPIDTTFMRLADADPPNGSTNEVYGWGRTCVQVCAPSEVLKRANVVVTSLDGRDGEGGRAISSRGLTGQSAPGDSGGPQVYDNAQVGVGSTADADGSGHQNYSSVAAHRGWIRQMAGV